MTLLLAGILARHAVSAQHGVPTQHVRQQSTCVLQARNRFKYLRFKRFYDRDDKKRAERQTKNTAVKLHKNSKQL